MATLYLPLKREYFNAIKDGSKEWEYRLYNAYWKKRLLVGCRFKEWEEIEICLGYPKRDDQTRRLTRPWREVKVETITHPHFGIDPVKVFAIRVN